MMPAIIANPDAHPEGREGDGLGTDRTPLPLNLVALIISYLSDPADLARACRTCRIFHYMCLPNLYSHVKLRSYDHIRYSPETAKPEGCGGGSPFAMGLNALVTRSVANYVRSFEVCGEYRELGSEDQARAGRVPDGGMMLSLLVRTALDRMGSLSTFSWNLNIKMLPVIWQGLQLKPGLTSLTVKFPTSRLPSPIFKVPGMPTLKSLCLRDMDPLCYPDNLTTLLCDSVNLEHLKLHWSPRMRRERESSVNLQMYFGKLLLSDRKLNLKSLAMQNLYSVEHEGNFLGMYNPNTLESMTAIDSTGGADDDANMSFIAEPPKRLAKMPMLRFLRGNKVSRKHCDGLGKMVGLHEYYLLTGRPLRDQRPGHAANSRTGSIASPDSVHSGRKGSVPYANANGGRSSASNTPQSIPDSAQATPASRWSAGGGAYATPSSTSSADGPVAALGRDYLDNIFRVHGASLGRWLLLPQWRLAPDDVERLVRCCPGLEQLGCSVEGIGVASGGAALDALGALAKGLPQLKALRLLDGPDDALAEEVRRPGGEEWYEERVGVEAWRPDGGRTLRWVGLGDTVFEVLPGEPEFVDWGGGEGRWRRRAVRRSLSVVREVQIWKMDRLDVL